ncbi:hypothetical protein BGZ65_004235 [Modicella reniformis]|uniref:Uncharacterized protein n=1 Tax=Modicella reniformis TaxID=1440133 RepID=A0A9P6MHE0_9FUNG|nr:hypothetical protein BGZ65_004235 [Modicella reniformis]
MLTNTLFASTLLVAFLSATTAAPPGRGQTCAIKSAKEFCLMLPPKYAGGIAEHEDSAIAFCTTDKLARQLKARTLPKGFIQSAYFTKGKDWVQVTGLINRGEYGLSTTDGGGQYDIKAPKWSVCQGYEHYVELVEPDNNMFCFKCCAKKEDCPVNKSTHGCRKILGGTYV